MGLRRERRALWHPKVSHPIESSHFDEEVGYLLREEPRLQTGPKERFHPIDGRLGQTAPMIASLLFPPQTDVGSGERSLLPNEAVEKSDWDFPHPRVLSILIS